MIRIRGAGGNHIGRYCCIVMMVKPHRSGRYVSITDSQNCPTTWVKETPLQAIIFYGIRKGLFNEYDYAPISSSFLGQGRKFVNISKEGEDDLGDLREIGLLETIRLSSTKHDYITGYRPTTKSAKHLQIIPNEIKERIDNL